MSTFPWLTVIGAVPLVGALAIVASPGAPRPAARPTGRPGGCWSSGWPWCSA